MNTSDGSGSNTASAPGLAGRARKLAEDNVSPDETIEFTIVGEWRQCIVALQDRLLVIKPGFMAGATFGGRVTSFYYRDINGIEVNKGLITGTIEVNSPSYQGTQQRDYWSTRDKDKDPFKVSNCIPIAKVDLKRQQPELERLRTKIKESKQERAVATHAAPAQNGAGFVGELERLASLYQSGVLSAEEFQQAKKKLLS
jgi:hypothetical protein